MKDTWEKVFEYASVPLHGTMSRKLRQGVQLQINEGKIFDGAVVFLGEFVRFTEEQNNERINTYYDWEKIESIRTYSKKEA